MRTDPQTNNLDIWTYDLATGKGTAITNDVTPENAPIWSPDGKQIAYVSTRDNYAGIYVKSADGTGQEEMVFRYTPGAGMVLTDWSPDRKFMTFYTGVLLLVPLSTNQPAVDRKAIEWLREDYDAIQGRFSPDGRYLAFLSNEANPDKMEVYVRPFDGNKPDAPASAKGVQVSKNGAIGMVFWRQDGKEMYYMSVAPLPIVGNVGTLYVLVMFASIALNASESSLATADPGRTSREAHATSTAGSFTTFLT